MNKQSEWMNEKGQSLIIVALIMVALIAVLALALDGGNVYYQRRNAQNAADAAALAGANAYCKEENPSTAYANGLNAANAYAGLNGFVLSDFSVSTTPTKQISVTTTSTFDTFFGGFVGWDQMTAQATAASACCTYNAADHIMPIAWACHRPSTFNQDVSSSDDCVAQILADTRLQDYIDYDGSIPYPYTRNNGQPYEFYKELYIVMDSSSEPDDLSTVCWQYDASGNPIDPDPSTPIVEGMDCDFDDDGENDLVSNGDRSWVDLDGGGGGADDLRNWVTDGLNSPLHLPIWVDGQPGVSNSTFHDIASFANNYFLIPVFDAICAGDPRNCSSTYNNEPILEYHPNSYDYRLVTFAVFYVTCVFDGGSGSCPGHDYMEDTIATLDPNGTSGFKANTKSIEGYFVDKTLGGNFDSNCTGNGIDFGAYVTRLTR